VREKAVEVLQPKEGCTFPARKRLLKVERGSFQQEGQTRERKEDSLSKRMGSEPRLEGIPRSQKAHKKHERMAVIRARKLVGLGGVRKEDPDGSTIDQSSR